jgi:hypothetical protein
MPVQIRPGPPSADVTATVTASADEATIGQPVTYRVVVANDGPSEAVDVAVQLGGVLGVQSTPSLPSSSGGNDTQDRCARPTFCIPLVAPGQRITMELGLLMGYEPDGFAHASVEAEAASPDPHGENNVASVRARALPPPATADLGITVTGLPTPVYLGGVIHFRAVVVNHGPDVASDLAVEAHASGRDAVIAGVSGDGSCGRGAYTPLRCSIERLAPGATATVAMDVRVRDLGYHAFSAWVRSSTFDPSLVDWRAAPDGATITTAPFP